TFLLEVAGESPRLKQDGRLFQKEETRFLDAMPSQSDWLAKILKTSPEKRLSAAFDNARTFGFTESESEDKATWLRLSGKGRSWLSAGLEEQYGKLYEYFRSTAKKVGAYDYRYDGDYYYDSYGDSKFFGLGVSVQLTKGAGSRYQSYYSEVKPEQREALRTAARKSFEALPV